MRKQTLLGALLVLICIVGSAVGQLVPCTIGDDGFNTGNCCDIPVPNLPNITPVLIDGKYGCLRGCNLEAQFIQSIYLDFNWLLCDLAIINMTVTPTAAGGPSFAGPVIAKYSRTWRRTNAAGVPEQIWRFLINTDVTYSATAAAASPCPVPPCALAVAGVSSPVHFVGCIDYICDPTNIDPATGLPIWRVRMDLTHHVGCYSHAPFTTRPLVGGAAHGNRSYHLVSPASFVFAPVVEPMGPVLAEAVRPTNFSWFPFAYQCLSEEKVVQGNLTTVAQQCVSCGPIPPAGPPIYKHQSLVGTTSCPPIATTFATYPIAGFLPGGMVSLTLGSYIGSPIAPGPSVVVHFGVMEYPDPCTQSGPYHIFTGTTTVETLSPGSLFPLPGTAPDPPYRVFMDLQNVKILPIYSYTPFPVYPNLLGFGSLFASDEVWNLNLM